MILLLLLASKTYSKTLLLQMI